MPPAALTLWTIYRRPLDLPHAEYVVRAFDVVGGQPPIPRPDHAEASTLDGARLLLPLTVDTCLGRQPDDDPAIVETWV